MSDVRINLFLYYVSAIARLTSIPLWVLGYIEGQGLVLYRVMTNVYAYHLIKNDLRLKTLFTVVEYATYSCTCHSKALRLTVAGTAVPANVRH